MPAGTTFVPPPTPAPWSCLPFGGSGQIKCLHPPSSIPAGGQLTVTVTFQIPPNYTQPTLSNCSEFFIGQPAVAAVRRRVEAVMDAGTLRAYLQMRGVTSVASSIPVNGPDDKSCTTVNIVQLPPGIAPRAACALPLVPGPIPGTCVCRPGTVQRGAECVPPPFACAPPMVAGPVPGVCICPPGTVQRGAECVRRPPECRLPMVPGAVPGVCVCPPGTVQRGGTCVRPIVCRSPLIANAAGSACVCPAGLVQRGLSCVQPTVCNPPAKLNRRGVCECPTDMVAKGNTCVAREQRPPAIAPDPRRPQR